MKVETPEINTCDGLDVGELTDFCVFGAFSVNITVGLANEERSASDYNGNLKSICNKQINIMLENNVMLIISLNELKTFQNGVSIETLELKKKDNKGFKNLKRRSISVII